MGIFDFFTGRRSKLKQLEKMTVGELEKEQIRLESQQDSIIGKVKTLEKRKNAILTEGAKKGSDLERKTMAVKYKQVDAESKGYVQNASMVSKQIQITGRLMQIKRGEELLRQAGLWSTISEVDTSELEQWFLDQRTRATQGDREASRLLEILDEPLAGAEDEHDKDLIEIMAAMETIAESEPTEEDLEDVKKKIAESAVEADDV